MREKPGACCTHCTIPREEKSCLNPQGKGVK